MKNVCSARIQWKINEHDVFENPAAESSALEQFRDEFVHYFGSRLSKFESLRGSYSTRPRISFVAL